MMRLTSLLFTLIASTSGLQIAAVRARVAELPPDKLGEFQRLTDLQIPTSILVA